MFNQQKKAIDNSRKNVSLVNVREKNRQQSFQYKTWGGKRKGSGRKRHTDELAHRQRPALHSNHPVHVTIRVKPGTVSLRRSRTYKVLRQAFRTARRRLGMRLCHFAVLGNHVHFIVEANDKVALRRAMTGVNVRIARSLNRLMNRRGQVISDRYHARPLTTPTEVRNALGYVMNNARHHEYTASALPDVYSSWADMDAVVPPETWLLLEGWGRGTRRSRRATE